MKLSIVIPAYNEEKNISGGVLEEVNNYLTGQKYSWEVILVDDASTDNTLSLLNGFAKGRPNYRVLAEKHRGKGGTVIAGMLKAKGEIVLFTDMDQSTPIAELSKLIPYLDKGYNAVIGSRGLKRKDFPLYRKMGATIFSTFRRALILPEISDTQCGFKLFRKESLAGAFPKLEFFKKKEKVVGWKVTSFDVELLHILKILGCKIKEVEVAWTDRDRSTSKGGALKKYFKESKEMVMQILRVKLDDLKGHYD